MKILFICEYNACRSQMAEGLARELLPKNYLIHSAGLYPGEVHPMTINVMKEIHVDISCQRSKKLAEVSINMPFDYLIVLANPAWDKIAGIQALKKLLWHFPDPAAEPGTHDEIMQRMRHVRDGLKKQIQHYFIGDVS